MDYAQRLDPTKLVLTEIALSAIIVPFSSPFYNLPIFLFGSLALENVEAVQSLRIFSVLSAASFVFDIIWMARNGQGWFTRLVTIVIQILKIPTFVAVFATVNQRGGANFGGLGVSVGDISGPTVWSMPGGFTSGGREGYQTVDEEVIPAPKVPAAQSARHGIVQPASGAYETV